MVTMTKIFTASAFNKLISIADASFLLSPRAAIFDATSAPTMTARPPKKADNAACTPESASAKALTTNVATNCMRSILLKTWLVARPLLVFSVVIVISTVIFETGFSKVRDFELLSCFSQVKRET